MGLVLFCDNFWWLKHLKLTFKNKKKQYQVVKNSTLETRWWDGIPVSGMGFPHSPTPPTHSGPLFPWTLPPPLHSAPCSPSLPHSGSCSLYPIPPLWPPVPHPHSGIYFPTPAPPPLWLHSPAPHLPHASPAWDVCFDVCFNVQSHLMWVQSYLTCSPTHENNIFYCKVICITFTLHAEP